MSESNYYYDMDKANMIRLKVNRANMIQSLRVDDELLSSLMKSRLIFYKEASEILQGKSREEKAKLLLDCLMTRKHLRKDWYLQFRSILAERNYKDLVIFLDSTIVNYKPKFLEKFSKNSSLIYQNMESQITNSDNSFDVTKDFKTIYKLASQKLKSINLDNLNEMNMNPLVENLPTYVVKPINLMSELESSDDPEDNKQMGFEYEEFDTFRKLEILYSIYVTDPESLNGSLFLDTQIAFKLLNSNNSHMHIKYYHFLNTKFHIDLLRFLSDSLVAAFKKGKIIRLRLFKSLSDLVNKLAWTLIRNEKHEYANHLLEEYLVYLSFIHDYLLKINTENNNLNHETLKSFNALLSDRLNVYSLLLIVKLNLFDFTKPNEIIKQTEIIVQELTKNGEEPDTTILNFAIGAILLEQSQIQDSFDYFNKALITLNYYDEVIIDVIGAASLCYSSKWLIAKAENLAIIGIQAAKYFYSKNSPKFIKALLFYCYFSNEFIQDQSSIRIAEYTLNLAKKVFGFDSIEIADANRALSKALIINKMFRDEIYYDCAQKAYKIARDVYKNNSAKLIAYKISLSLALQWKSVNTNIIEIKKVNINDAFNLAQQALETCMNVFGESNLSTAKIYRLIGSIFYYMERDSDSENSNRLSLDLFKACLPPDDLHYLIAKSSYGIFLRMIGKIDDALNILLEVVNAIKFEELNNIVGYCKWIPSIYDNIYYCYRQINSQEMASYYQKQADNLRIVASQKEYYRHDILSIELYRKPPFNLHDFLKEYILK